jgi:HD-GYP domain-containing protein (c-di-GMP phosphodiesterase class II)
MELPMILYHHERYDGKGYPSGLKGKCIPLGARIIRVACACAGNSKDVKKELSGKAGSELDPEIVGILLKALKK